MKTDLYGRITQGLLDLKKERQLELVIVGIEGKGCSGKTTMAADIRDCLVSRGAAAQVASIDDFCNRRVDRVSPEIEVGLQVYHLNFDEDLWEAEILQPASLGRLTCDRDSLNVVTGLYDRSVSVHLPNGGFLIAEGVHILKRRFAPYFDYTILVHISDEEQMRRAMRRDPVERGYTPAQIEEKYQNRMVPSYEHFLAVNRPNVDLVIDNHDPDHPVVMSDQEAEPVTGHVRK